jgi:PAS domain S-box-containing protein
MNDFLVELENMDAKDKKIKKLEVKIAQLKKVERESKASGEHYKKLFEGVEDGIYTLDLKGRFTSGNRKSEEICGYKRGELIGKYFTTLLPNKIEVLRVMKIFKDILMSKGGAYRFEAELKNKQGDLVPIEIKGSILKEGMRPIGLLGIARDIGERKKAEEELKAKNEDLEKFQVMATGRELKMIELKEKIKELEIKLNNREKY